MTTYDSTRPLTGQLAEAAKVEKDELIRFNLNLVKTELWDALKAFERAPTGDNLIAVNAKWAQGVRLLGFATASRTPGGNGAGLKDGALLQKVA